MDRHIVTLASMAIPRQGMYTAGTSLKLQHTCRISICGFSVFKMTGNAFRIKSSNYLGRNYIFEIVNDPFLNFQSHDGRPKTASQFDQISSQLWVLMCINRHKNILSEQLADTVLDIPQTHQFVFISRESIRRILKTGMSVRILRTINTGCSRVTLPIFSVGQGTPDRHRTIYGV